MYNNDRRYYGDYDSAYDVYGDDDVDYIEEYVEVEYIEYYMPDEREKPKGLLAWLFGRR